VEAVGFRQIMGTISAMAMRLAAGGQTSTLTALHVVLSSWW
jgi:hypothetical protein